jgi:hypothetical protein
VINNFRGKNIKDTESAAETIISNANLLNNTIYENAANSKISITGQNLNDESFDTFLEKRK